MTVDDIRFNIKHGACVNNKRGEYFADTHFTAIHTSDLQRAFATARALYDHQRDPKLSLDSSELLRELNFGLAEGKPRYYEADSALAFKEYASTGVYSVLYKVDNRFPGGESIEDLAERAKIALEKIALFYVWQVATEGKTGIYVAIVSHGWQEHLDSECSHLSNIAWTRVVIDIEVGSRIRQETW